VIAAGVEEAGAEADRRPVADGGEGTMEVLMGALGGERRTVAVHDPLRRQIVAEFAVLDDGRTAVVETARAAGLTLVAVEERDAERADTYGAGELIAAALGTGAETVLVAVGGSATTDGGRGAIEALDERGMLEEAARIEVLCDVRASFEDAARLFAPQKGADPATVGRLIARLARFAGELPRDPRGMAMGGCAGGVSGGLWAYGARLRAGAAFVLDAVSFDQRLAAADAVISGEGRLDSQSLEGKVVGEIAKRCATAGKPLHLVVGANALGGETVASFASITQAESLAELQRKAFELARGS
jgi:glycerate 2-kinase